MSRDSLGEFEHQILLAILRLGGEAYSVPLVIELEERTGREVSQAQVFIVLCRLEAKGLLVSHFSQGPEASGRVRRYFRTTPRAVKKLRDTRRELKRLWDGLGPVLES